MQGWRDADLYGPEVSYSIFLPFLPFDVIVGMVGATKLGCGAHLHAEAQTLCGRSRDPHSGMRAALGIAHMPTTRARQVPFTTKSLFQPGVVEVGPHLGAHRSLQVCLGDQVSAQPLELPPHNHPSF